ncbi:MAG: acetylglutamate kinase [Promethearchaeota archaeon]
MKDYIEKAKVLIEALPYIKEFRGKVFVIKYGGSAMKNTATKESIMEDIVLMKLVGIRPVLVHGGGSVITKVMKRMGIKPNFINGLRVTDADTMEIVEMVLAGKVNKGIVSEIQGHNLNAIGICGKDGNTLLAKKKKTEGYDLGYVGEVVKVNTDLLNGLINNDIIPVIAPIGKDEEGNTYNINADSAASAIASALKAEKLLYLTDVEGVLRDINDSSSLISVLKLGEISEYLENKTISGGMIPKVECCTKAVRNGVNMVHILDGRVEHSLLLEIFTKKGLGTMFIN